MRARIKKFAIDTAILSVKAFLVGIVIIAQLVIASAIVGDREQEALDEINAGTRATACILALPISEDGRDETAVKACLRAHGLVP